MFFPPFSCWCLGSGDPWSSQSFTPKHFTPLPHPSQPQHGFFAMAPTKGIANFERVRGISGCSARAALTCRHSGGRESYTLILCIYIYISYIYITTVYMWYIRLIQYMMLSIFCSIIIHSLSFIYIYKYVYMNDTRLIQWWFQEVYVYWLIHDLSHIYSCTAGNIDFTYTALRFGLPGHRSWYQKWRDQSSANLGSAG